eukprot:TRINITY_DN15525_c0_g1_i1.p1 TRINITY_DN15525_c0_g1~~TRINITY_DN15525_c0_g1_i1.p1  ORF type:complete len:312 (-),score=63.56 TRINITY_DN15525_c0_g1_i1:150-1085(-)
MSFGGLPPGVGPPGTMMMPGSMHGPPGTMMPGSMPPGMMPGTMMPGTMMPGTMPPVPPGTMIPGMGSFGAMPPNMGPQPMMGPPPTMVPGGMPPMTMPIPPRGVSPPRGSASPRGRAGRDYAVAAEGVRQRMIKAGERRAELSESLDILTNGAYAERQKKVFSAAKKAGVDNIDWRVPKLMACKDPAYNAAVPPQVAHEVAARKLQDGTVLENELAYEAYGKWAEKLKEADQKPPPLEVVYGAQHTRTPFQQSFPGYDATGEHWHRTLELRPLDQAMNGDVSKPMPAPMIYDEDSDNFREGKYVKDDCPIA